MFNKVRTLEAENLDDLTWRAPVASSRQPGLGTIRGLGTAFPPQKYTQAEVKALLGIENRTVHKLLESGHIRTRHLYLPEPREGKSSIEDETPAELQRKFHHGVLEIGVTAVRRALASAGLAPGQADFLICVTSTGFMVPGVSSLVARQLRFRSDLYRLDVVGMGCNAGMTALRTAAALTASGKSGILLCCEINSAIYVRDESTATGIVNSLFGDGASAVVLGPTGGVSAEGSSGQRPGEKPPRIELLDFETFTLPEQWSAMRFNWNEPQGKWSFQLSKQIPFVVGENLKHPVGALLSRHNLATREIRHWTIHTGGAAVIEGAKRSLGLSEEHVRHTRSVLRDYGNLSSGSFLVSLERLFEEHAASGETIRDGDLGMLIAMGPGATLEAGLVRYLASGGGVDLL